MEEKTTKEMLEEQIREAIEKLSKTDKTGVDYGPLVNNIQDLIKAWCDLDRAESEKNDRDRRFAEDVRFKDQELHWKDSLERDKMSEQRKSGIRDSVIKIVSVIFSVAPTVALALLGMKLEFIDHGSVCSFGVKELLKRASQTVKMI